MPVTTNHKRLTISFPVSMDVELEKILNDLNISRSELFKRAFEEYLQKYKKLKLEYIAKMMKTEYEGNKELTAFTELDGEDFK